MIARRTSASIVVIVIPTTAIFSTAIGPATGRADDASIRLKGAGWGGLCQNR